MDHIFCIQRLGVPSSELGDCILLVSIPSWPFFLFGMRNSGGVAFASHLPGHSELLYSRVATAQEDRVQLKARVTSELQLFHEKIGKHTQQVDWRGEIFRGSDFMFCFYSCYCTVSTPTIRFASWNRLWNSGSGLSPSTNPNEPQYLGPDTRQYEAKATIFEPNFPQSTPYESHGSDTFRLVQGTIYRNHLSFKGKNPLVSSFRRKKKPKPTKKNFASLSRSPIFSHFSETLDGTALIRAFGQQQIFISENMSRVNRNMRAYYSNFSSNRCWLWKMFGTWLVWGLRE